MTQTHNPLKIQKNKGRLFLGELPSSNPPYARFISAMHCFRVAFRILHGYAKEGAQTLADLLTRWPLPGEVDRAAFIKAVAERAGLSDTAEVDTLDEAQIKTIVAAMAAELSGEEPTEQQISMGWVIFKTNAK